MITGCCACPATSAAFTSKALVDAKSSCISLCLTRLAFHYDDRPGHLRVDRAVVGVGARLTGRYRELLVCVQGTRFLELLLDAYHRMRPFVAIHPGHLLARMNGESRRI